MPKKAQYHHGDLKNALIKSSVRIISKEGAHALSLRKAARQAGVSHAAPYAHFADKQALIAAISTEGYKKLYEQIARVAEQYRSDPLRRFVEACWAYVQFALDEPDHFKITLSNLVEKEQDYPAFMEIAKQTFSLVVEIVTECQQAKILRKGPADLTAVSVWALIHGLVSLILENQISHTILDRITVREMFIFSLNQITRVELDPAMFPLPER
jgi:AcrR family transcriptional regulator